MAIRAELLLAVPVCIINSSYTLRLNYLELGFFLNCASMGKTEFVCVIQRSDLIINSEVF